MSVGENIKKLRELRNYTQQYMADKLEMSQSGYGKIERNETDLSISRLKQIAEILEVEFDKVLSFDERQVFNIYNNHNAMGFVANQQLIQQNDQLINELFLEINKLREEILNLKKRS